MECKNSSNCFETLPLELIFQVMNHLEGKDLSNCEMVCKLFNQSIQTSSFDSLRWKKYAFLSKILPSGLSQKESLQWAVHEMKQREMLARAGMIDQLKMIGTRSFASLESLLRKYYYLGQNESLIKRLLLNHARAKAIGLSHQEVAGPFLNMIDEYCKTSKAEFEIGDERFKVVGSRRARQPSLFDFKENDTITHKPHIFTFIRQSDKCMIELDYFLLDAIARFGFYGGLVMPFVHLLGTMPTLSPGILASFLKLNQNQAVEPMLYEITTKQGLCIRDYTEIAVLLDQEDVLIIKDVRIELPRIPQTSQSVTIRLNEDQKIDLTYQKSEGDFKHFSFDPFSQNETISLN